MTLNFGAKEWFVFIISILLLTDLAILLNILFLRQIIGFAFLTILFGFLILRILNLDKLEFIEKFVLSVGLSISFLMFFVLLLNNLSLNLGFETPLSTIPLLISFNIVFIILGIIGYKVNKTSIFSIPNLNLSTSEKAFLITPILFPALSIFGMHVMNTTDNNIILMFLLFSIPIYVAFVCFFNQKFSTRLYPVVIFSISISLLLLLSLRSNHIIGADTHLEYFLFKTTLDNLHWRILTMGNALDACLSVSVLPAIYQLILNISPEFLFKILYSSVYSTSPLIIYIISKKYVGEMYGFLASCFFMFQSSFLWTEAWARISIAILFFALAMMTLFNDKIDPLKKRILFIIFMASCMVSHYSTTYIFFFILLGTFIGIEILSKKYTLKKIVSLTIVILFFSMIFFWYSQVTETAFNSGVSFVEDTIQNLNKFFIEESRTESLKPLMGKELTYPILSHAYFILTWCTFILIGIGVLTVLKRYKEMVALSNVKHKKPDFLKTKFEMEYLAMVAWCAGLLVIAVALPYVSIGYGIQRLYPSMLVILSVCFVIGGMTLSQILKKNLIKNFSLKRKALPKTLFASKKRLRKNISQKTFKKHFTSESVNKGNALQVRAYLIILLILIPYSMFTSGLIYQLLGVSESIIFNSEGERYDMDYVHDHDSYGARWLKWYAEERNQEVYATPMGKAFLTSQGKISPKDITLITEPREVKDYIYLKYDNVINDRLYIQSEYHNMTEYSIMFVGKSKIYNNGGAEIWK